MRLSHFVAIAWIALGMSSPCAEAAGEGVPISFELPKTPGKTYMVTLATVEESRPDWVVSTFVAGEPFTVTAENKGRFTVRWDGLDENFMPVPPGSYGLKGIYSEARVWPVDGEMHAITPRFAGGASPWLPSPDRWELPVPFGGDPVNAPLQDVAVGPNGVAVFYYQYLENGTNCPMFDLNKPIGYEQFVRAFASGGAGGGPVAATDGEMVWAFSTDGGPRFVYRADQKSFGQSPGANRRNGYLPEGWVTGMAVTRDTPGSQPIVYVAQRGKIVAEPVVGGGSYSHRHVESKTESVDQLTVHDGLDGRILQTLKLERPHALILQGGALYALQAREGGFVVSALTLKEGLPAGEWRKVFDVPPLIVPADLERDAAGRFYLSDASANKVYQCDDHGKVLRTFGRAARQEPGKYNRETFMAPGKLATWRDKDGLDRLLVVDQEGPNRVSEWNANDGTLIRDFLSHQTKCNNGYAIDPADSSAVYLPGHGGWLTRFKIHPQTREWRVDAVWPDVEAGQRKGLDKPVAVRVQDRFYLASEQNLTIYRLDGNQWKRSAGLIQQDKKYSFWNDANNNGAADAEELRPAEVPKGVLTYHGQRWLADLSYVAPAMGGQEVWRLAPESFDAHGNPVFQNWQKVLTDPVFAARTAATANALHGGNELSDNFSSDWMQVDGSMKDGFYVQARGGRNFDANRGPQHKVSRYVPDGKGGFALKWRVGRSVLGGAPRRGELTGGMRLFKPVNGLLTVVDQSRSGLFLYTEDGLYVDTLFPPGERKGTGVYQQPGEFFAGSVFPDPASGRIFYGSGKYTPLLYEMQGWTLSENPVRRLTSLPKDVSIRSSEVASPPEMALSLRGGAGKARVARFSPALGGAVLDGSLTGWEGAAAVTYGPGKERFVEARGLYDPEHLYLRWHVRLGEKFQPKPTPPLERLFTHDQASETVGFYFQGDLNAPAKGAGAGRSGDVRLVFGLFQNQGRLEPAVVGLYPKWPSAKGKRQVYRTPVGEAAFEHVGDVAGVKLGHALDEDGKGFVIVASIHRAAFPALKAGFDGAFRTQVNFDANLGGHQKFWWANTDGSASAETYDEPSEARFYPGSWAPLTFEGLDRGVVVQHWHLLGPFGGPGAEKFTRDPQNKPEVQKFYEAATFPPDDGNVDLKASYEGPQIKGYWPEQKRLQWKPAKVADLDTRIICGEGSQVNYGTTWVHVPEDKQVTFEFQGHRMTHIRWSLNGEGLDVPLKEYQEGGAKQLMTASRPVQLKKGWNHVFFRSFNVGYVPYRVGLVVKGATKDLWDLRFADQPPDASGQ